ncbi:RE1-silencing transcription factor A [Portunus trituberculatus]|uniref:RE1-silencing transcription factor A n=1 Tax=Portunus trituberculatus TaxID=210409 RepID=A0A5B7JMC9_PORTR|nr:RE1-silencing transcription factor A [Portunus trituberculatus]
MMRQRRPARHHSYGRGVCVGVRCVGVKKLIHALSLQALNADKPLTYYYAALHKATPSALAHPRPGEKAFPCPHCPYRASQRIHLHEHIRIHTGEKPFHCPHCPYQARTNYILTKHIRRHTGEKPFACPACHYRAAQRSHLVTHLRTHAPVRYLSCPRCPYKTPDDTRLLEHIRMHEEEGPAPHHAAPTAAAAALTPPEPTK